MREMTRTCETCRWFRKYRFKDATAGECRRFPPQARTRTTFDDGDPYTSSTWEFPDVAADEGCGEYAHDGREPEATQ